ncbi:MAG: Plug domain-containing protein [Bacteroidota bacterium]
MKLFLIFCYNTFLFSQYDANFKHDFISGKLRTYSELNAPEKLYLLSDKDVYLKNDTIWFKTYLVNGVSHKKSKKSGVVYVDLLNEKDSVLVKRKLFVKSIGASGDIVLHKDIFPGRYKLRAYTQYMLNNPSPIIFEKNLVVWGDRSSEVSDTNELFRNENEPVNTKQKLSVSFFPEGGDMIAELQNVLGFEIKDQYGNGFSTQGKIIDENGIPVCYFQSHDFGLGVLNFTPKKNQKYYAIVENGGETERFLLPQPLDDGYMLNVRNNGDHLIILASSTLERGLQDAFLVGHLRGDVFFERSIVQESIENRFTYKLYTDELADGVAHFTLFDKGGEPLCERLVFIDNPNNDAYVKIKSSKIELGHRDNYQVDLHILDSNNNLVSGELSMSVFKANRGLSSENQNTHIKTWLLLNSDLGATVSNAAYFFEDNSVYRKRLLDALMLTHGWRRFVWKEFLSNAVGKTPKYKPEKGIMINGKTTLWENPRQPRPSEVKLSLMGKNILQDSIPTGNTGEFTFGPFFFQDTISAVIQVLSAPTLNKKGVKVRIEPVTNKIESYTRKSFVTKHNVGLKEFTFPDYASDIDLVSNFKIGDKVRRLKEVKVYGKGKRKRDVIDEEIGGLSRVYNKPSHRIYVDSFPKRQVQSALDYLLRFPGVRVFGSYPRQTVQITAANSISFGEEPLFLFDGLPVTAQFAAQLTAKEVMMVDVLKGPDATIYGVRGANGVVALYGKRSLRETTSTKQYPGVTNLEIPGFYKTREFYAPDYSTPRPEHNKLDYRTTLHWKPSILMDGNNKVSFKQFTGDIPGKYIIKVEGITDDGQPVFHMSSIVVTDNYTKVLDK